MKTKLTKLMFALFAVMVGTSVNAQTTSGECGDNATWSYESTTLTISGTGAMYDYAYGEAPWKDYADALKYVEIETGVTSVGNNAFAGFTALKSVTFPSEGFTSIGEYAFSGCTSFKNLNMPSSMTTIGDGAFSGSAVRGATIYGGVTKIGDYAFETCTNLEGVAIYEGVEEIGENAFDGCGLISVVIPSTVTTIGGGAFMSNAALETVYIGAGVTNIGAAAFQGCTALTSVGLGGATAPTLGDAVFDQGDGLTPLAIDAFYVPSTTPYSGGWGGYAANKFKTLYEGTWTYHDNNTDTDDAEKGTGTWSFNVATGALTVNGTGNLNVSPWMGMASVNPTLYDNEHPGYWSKVLSFVVGEGITHIQTMGVGMQINCASVTLPSTLKYIGYSCLEECAFTSIELPEGLETIDDYTFFYSKLTSLTIPSTVTYIGSSAFLANEDLATITCLPVTPPDLGPYEPCFGDGSTITAIYVPAGSVDAYKNWEWDESIGYTQWNGWKDYASLIQPIGDAPATTTTFAYTASEQLTVFDDIANFTGATAVKSHEFASGTGTVVYEGTVTAIADYTFRYDNTAKSKMTSITLPASLTTTGEYTFWYCEALESVAFDGTPTLTTIGKSAFKECTALTAIAIPASVTSIGVSAFSGCSALASVTFTGTSSVSHINQSAFSGCTSLKNITLPESLTTLGTVQTDPEIYYNGSVFWNSGITSLNIPKNVSTIYGVGYFAGCNMTSLTVDAENATYADLGSNAIFEKATNKLVVGCNASSVPSGVTTIGFEAFWAIQEPFSLTLPATVTTIEARAFHLASGLTAINIPEGVTAIEDETFSGCSLTTLVIPNTVTTIGGMAFDSCNELTSLTLGSEVTTIGGGAFSYCNKLTALEIPAKVTALEGAFSSGNLATITVAAGNTKYDSRNNCNAIIDTESNTMLLGCKNTTFPDGVTKIGKGAFRSCLGLTTLNIPATVTEIGESAFAYCSNITELTIPSSISVISSYAFQGCKGLTTVNIPDNVTTIEGSAFSGCSGLTTVTLGSGLTSIAQRSFASCEAVTDVYCYANPENLTWNSAGLYFGYDFKDGKATLCHVVDADAWPCTSSSDKFYKVNVTFVGDLNTFTLAEDVDNSAAITGRNGRTCDVTLTRTLKTGSWNTFAAPFDIDAATLTAKGITAKKLTASSLNGSTLTLTFSDATNLEAGKPYLVKVAANVENPTFSGVTIVSATTAATTSYADLVPTTGKTLIVGATGSEDDANSVLILGAENKLSYPSVVNTPADDASYLKGFRAYFQMHDGAAPARIVLDLGDEASSINELRMKNVESTDTVYDLQGRRIGQTTRKGIYIVNGKKVVIK